METSQAESREMSVFIGSPAFFENLKIETYIGINPHFSIIYNMIRNADGSPMDKHRDNKLPELSHYMGLFSDKAKSRLKKSLNWLTHIAVPKKIKWKASYFTFKLTFVTLELPSKQVHEDSEILKCLQQFLLECQKKYNLLYYVWKAEKQKNGNVHYHLTMDCFIPWDELRKLWCTIINKLGYVDTYKQNQLEWHKDGFKSHPESYWKKNKDGSFKLDEHGKKIAHWSLDKQKRAYAGQMELPESERWMQPNCTDIHSVKGVKNLIAYLAEYFSKTDLTPDEEAEIKMIQDEIHIHKFELKKAQYLIANRTDIVSDLEIRIEILKEQREEIQKQLRQSSHGRETEQKRYTTIDFR